MVRRRRSTTGSAAGRCAACGGGCLKRWPEPSPAMAKPSTARPPRRTGRRRAEKGGPGAGDWPLARRAHDENPRCRRRARTSHRHRSDARPATRVAAALINAVPRGCRLAADAAYDSDGLRLFLLERGTVPVIPNNPTRKRRHPFDEIAYRQRNLIERMFCRLKDWRRIATRYDKLAATFAAAIMLAAIIIWWT